jgi:hypothetical protein
MLSARGFWQEVLGNRAKRCHGYLCKQTARDTGKDCVSRCPVKGPPLFSDDTIQFNEKCIDVHFVDACAVSQFFQVSDLTLEAVKAETLEYGDRLRIAAADFSDFHVFSNHDVSSVQGK